MPSVLMYPGLYSTLTKVYTYFLVVLSSVWNVITSPFGHRHRPSLRILPIHSRALDPAQLRQGFFTWLLKKFKSLPLAAYRFFDEIIFQFVDICLWYTPQYRDRATASWNSFSRNVKRRSSDMKTRVILAFRPASSFNLPVAVVDKDDGSWDFRDAEKHARPMTWLLFDPVRGCVTPSGTGTPRMSRPQQGSCKPSGAIPLPFDGVTVLAQLPAPNVPVPLPVVPPTRKACPPSTALSGPSVQEPRIYSLLASSEQKPSQGGLTGEPAIVSKQPSDPGMDVVVDLSPVEILSVPGLSVSASDDSILTSVESIEMDISECNDYVAPAVQFSTCGLSPELEQEEVIRISCASVHTFSAFPFSDIYRPTSYSKHVVNHNVSSSIYDLDSSANSSPSSYYSSTDSSGSHFSSGFTIPPIADPCRVAVVSHGGDHRRLRRNGMNLSTRTTQGVDWWQEQASSSRHREPPTSYDPQYSATYRVSKTCEQVSGLAIRLSSMSSERSSRPSTSDLATVDIDRRELEDVHENLEISSIDADCPHSVACATSQPLNTHASWVTFPVPDSAGQQFVISGDLNCTVDSCSSSRPPSSMSNDEASQENLESVTSVSTCDIPPSSAVCFIPAFASEPAIITEAEARAAARRVSLHGKLPRLRNSSRPAYIVWDEARRTRYVPSLTALQQRRVLTNMIYDSDPQDSRRVGLHGSLPRERRRTGFAFPVVHANANMGVEAEQEVAQDMILGHTVDQPQGMATRRGLRSLMLPAQVGMRPFVGGPQPAPVGSPPVRF